jgi:hypothetical protein
MNEQKYVDKTSVVPKPNKNILFKEVQVVQLHQTYLRHGRKLGGFLHQLPGPNRPYNQSTNQNIKLKQNRHFTIHYISEVGTNMHILAN